MTTARLSLREVFRPRRVKKRERSSIRWRGGESSDVVGLFPGRTLKEGAAHRPPAWRLGTRGSLEQGLCRRSRPAEFDSRRVPIVVLQETTEPFAKSNFTVGPADFVARLNQAVNQALVISFLMIVLDELVGGPSQRRLPVMVQRFSGDRACSELTAITHVMLL